MHDGQPVIERLVGDFEIHDVPSCFDGRHVGSSRCAHQRGTGFRFLFPVASYVGVAHAAPTEFVMPVISFALFAVYI